MTTFGGSDCSFQWYQIQELFHLGFFMKGKEKFSGDLCEEVPSGSSTWCWDTEGEDSPCVNRVHLKDRCTRCNRHCERSKAAWFDSILIVASVFSTFFLKKDFWIFFVWSFWKVFRFTFLSIGSALVKCNQISGDLCRTWSVTHSKLKLLPVHEVLSTCWLNWKKAGMPRYLGSQILESLEQVLMSSDQVTSWSIFFGKGCLGVSTLSCRAQAFWGRSSALWWDCVWSWGDWKMILEIECLGGWLVARVFLLLCKTPRGRDVL